MDGQSDTDHWIKVLGLCFPLYCFRLSVWNPHYMYLIDDLEKVWSRLQKFGGSV